MEVTVKKVVLKHLGGIIKYEVYIDNEYFGSANDLGELLILKGAARKFIEQQGE